MGQTIVCDRLSIEFPEGFREMDAAELRRVHADHNDERWGIWDRERHAMLVVYWHDAGAVTSKLLGGLASSKSLAERVRKTYRRMGKDSEYQEGELFSCEVSGREAWGFTCEYTVQGVRQAARIVLFKDDRRTFTVYLYTHKDLVDRNRQMFEGIMDSLALV